MLTERLAGLKKKFPTCTVCMVANAGTEERMRAPVSIRREYRIFFMAME